MRRRPGARNIITIALLLWLIYYLASKLNKNAIEPAKNTYESLVYATHMKVSSEDFKQPAAQEKSSDGVILPEPLTSGKLSALSNEFASRSATLVPTKNQYSKPTLAYEDPIQYSSTEPARIVVLSMTMDSTYGFFAPITAFLWTLMGWKPVVIAIGSASSWDESKLGRVLRDAILHVGGTIEYLPHHPSLFRNFKAGNIAQIARLLAGFMGSIKEDSYVLLADGDIWPFRPHYFESIDVSKGVCIMNANDYRRGKSDYQNSYRYPLTNIGAMKGNWRKVLGLDGVDLDGIVKAYQADAVEKVSVGHINQVDPKEDLFPAMVWYYMKQPYSTELIKNRKFFEFDELSFIFYLKKSEFWYSDVQFLTRDVGPDRLSKHSRDKRYDIFKAGEPFSFSSGEIMELNKLIDGHVGMKKKSPNHKELVIREEDTAYWLFIDRYWSAFKNASSDLVAVEVKGSKAV